MKPQQYYYLKDGKIWMANEKMPQGEDYVALNPTHFNKLDFEIDTKQWLNSLQPCEISESELCNIITYLQKNDTIGWTGAIEVTDLISGNNGVIRFKEPKQVDSEEIEAVELWKEVDRIFARHKSESLNVLLKTFKITRNI